MLGRTFALTLTGLMLGASLALAEPQFVLRYPGGIPQVSITGDYAGSSYTVWRAPAAGGEYQRITEQSILCLGSCYAQDQTAIAGASYLYLFELSRPGDSGAPPVSYGPYLATISPALARPVGIFVYPNPGRGPTGIQIHLAGSLGEGTLPVGVGIFDVAGRSVRALHRGELPRGLTTLTWDGRDDRGVALPPGVYLVRLSTGRGEALAPIVRR